MYSQVKLTGLTWYNREAIIWYLQGIPDFHNLSNHHYSYLGDLLTLKEDGTIVEDGGSLMPRDSSFFSFFFSFT